MIGVSGFGFGDGGVGLTVKGVEVDSVRSVPAGRTMGPVPGRTPAGGGPSSVPRRGCNPLRSVPAGILVEGLRNRHALFTSWNVGFTGGHRVQGFGFRIYVLGGMDYPRFRVRGSGSGAQG